MKHDLTIIKFLPLVLIASCFAFTQNVFARDNNNTGTAKITLSFSVADSTKEAKAVLTNADANGNDTAVKGVDIHFYIKRSFGLLPIEGDFTTTNENGEATVDFPNDVPGDKSGNITVIARVEDNDELGDLVASKTVNWGIPVNTEQTVQPRALWASANNAPWPLVFTVTGMVAIVWGIIVYIILQLVAIKRSGTLEM